jgi:rhomboid family GlyGly-CTERM serine protease
MFGLFTPRWTRSEIAFSGGLVALVLLLGALGEPARDWLRFDRAAIDGGQWWRLLSCHFVHLGAGHLWMDTLGLALLLLFFRDVFAPRDWAATVTIGALAIGFLLYLRDPQLGRYVGISGVLHTMLFAGLLLSFRHNPVLNGVVFIAMAARIWTEQQPGYDVNYLRESIGGAVMVNAHWYGALVSLPVVALLWRRSQLRQRQFRGLETNSVASAE